MSLTEQRIERASTFSDRAAHNSQQLAIGFLVWCRDARHRSKLTVKAYASTLDMYLTFLDDAGVTDVRHATREIMEAFVQRPRVRRAHGRVGSPATQRRDVAVLRTFYSWLWEEGVTPTNLARSLHGPTVHNQNPRPIPDDDWIRLWETHQGYDNLEAHVVLGLGFYTGLRRHEIMGLQRSQFRQGKIRNFTRKGGGEDVLPYVEMAGAVSDRMPHLFGEGGIDSFLGAVERMKETNYPDGRIVGWKSRDPGSVNKHMSTWLGRAGISHYTPHQLRHSAATNLLRADVPLHLVQRLMNHSSIDTTMRYVRATGDELAEWRRRNL